MREARRAARWRSGRAREGLGGRESWPRRWAIPIRYGKISGKKTGRKKGDTHRDSSHAETDTTLETVSGMLVIVEVLSLA